MEHYQEVRMTAEDLDRFRTELVRNPRVRPNQVPYYVKWVKGFLRHRSLAAPSRSTPDIVSEYRASLEQKGIPDWQVNQAVEAVSFFLRVTGTDNSPAATACEGDWSDLEGELIRQLRVRNRSRQTERTYLQWFRQFRGFVAIESPSELDDGHVRSFLTHLAVERNVSAGTQRQAFNAILFLFRFVLDREVTSLSSAVRARASKHLPVVLSRREIDSVMGHMSPAYAFPARLIYGTGMRLGECLALRIKDIDIERGAITVRSGKGDKDRTTVLPTSLVPSIEEQIGRARSVYDTDRQQGNPGVPLPSALAHKYPNASTEWPWFWLFPSNRLVRRSPGRYGGPFPPVPFDAAARVSSCGTVIRSYQASIYSHPAPQLRDPPDRGGLRYPDGSGASRPFRCENDDDLHPRRHQEQTWRGEPDR
jgi:integrase